MTVAALPKTSLSQTEAWHLNRINKELSEISTQLNEVDANERRYEDLFKSILGSQDSPTTRAILFREKQKLSDAALQTISGEQMKLLEIAQRVDVDVKLLEVLGSIFLLTKEIKDRQLHVLGNKEIKIYQEHHRLKESVSKTKKRVDDAIKRWESKKALLHPEVSPEGETLVSKIELTSLDKKSGSPSDILSLQKPQQRNRLISNFNFTLGAALCATAVAVVSLALKTFLFK